MKPEGRGEELNHQQQCHDLQSGVSGLPQESNLDRSQPASPKHHVSQVATVGSALKNMEQRTTIDKPTKKGGDYSESIAHPSLSVQHSAFHPSYDSEESDGR